MQSRRVLPFVVVLALLAGVSPEAQEAQQTGAPQRTPEEQRDIQALVQLVDGVVAGTQPAPADVPVIWESNHFVRSGDGATYIPYTLSIDPASLPNPEAAVYVRVMTREQVAAAATPPADPAAAQNVTYPWNNIYFVELPASGEMQRALQLQPGEYEVFVATKAQTTADAADTTAPERIGLLRHQLTVPDFGGDRLSTSSVFIADAIEPVTSALTAQQQQEQPYTFGSMRIVPSEDNRLSTGGELQVLFWIYGVQQTNGKPNVTVEFNFHRRTPEGEQYFNKTAPQELNAQTLPPEFDMSMGHQLPGSIAVPLASFPAGDYRLEILITDHASGQTLTENAEFTVVEG